MHLFARITKIDVAKRQVVGTLVQEVPDRSGEIFDYDTSKAHFQGWSEGIHKATEGKSVGNMRSMHTNLVAGKFTDIQFDDAKKSIEVVGEVVDDAEWKKVESGCYTGFSIGGKYEKKWADPVDPTLKRYTAIPSEGSLVDMPCVPTAQFKMVKADGSEELHKFHIDNAPVAKLLVVGMMTAAPMLKTLASALGVEYGMDETGVLKILDAVTGKVAPGLEDVVKSLDESLRAIAAEHADPEALARAAADELSKSNASELTKATARIAEIEPLLIKAADDLAKATGERDTALAKAADLEKQLAAANAKAVTPPGNVRAISKAGDVNVLSGGDVNVDIDKIVVKRADGSLDAMATAMAQIRASSNAPMLDTSKL